MQQVYSAKLSRHIRVGVAPKGLLEYLDVATRRNLQGHMSFLQGRSEIIDLFMDSERPANLNSAVPVPLSTKNVPKITCHRGTGHRSSKLQPRKFNYRKEQPSWPVVVIRTEGTEVYP